jgi:hypothetical protein
MPLPKSLPKKASKTKKKAVMGKVMSELKHSPVEAPSRKATSGTQRHKQDVAIALKKSGQSKDTPAKGRSPKRKRPSNKGRS